MSNEPPGTEWYIGGPNHEECETCEDTLEVICEECDGSGVVKANKITLICPDCLGKGVVRCPDCIF